MTSKPGQPLLSPFPDRLEKVVRGLGRYWRFVRMDFTAAAFSSLLRVRWA